MIPFYSHSYFWRFETSFETFVKLYNIIMYSEKCFLHQKTVYYIFDTSVRRELFMRLLL